MRDHDLEIAVRLDYVQSLRLIIRGTPSTLNLTLLDLLVDLVLIFADWVKVQYHFTILWGHRSRGGLRQVDRKVWDDKRA